jgi:hypothetical protein
LNRRVLYIVIVVFVLVVAVVLLRPLIFGRPQQTVATRTKKTGQTDSAATAAKATKGTAKARAARARAAAREEPAAKAAEPGTAVKTEAATAARDTVQLEWGSDPFVRDWLTAGELRDLRVRAVTIGERPMALINDRVASLGDTVNGKRIALITRDSVVFEFGGQRRGLKIGE